MNRFSRLGAAVALALALGAGSAGGARADGDAAPGRAWVGAWATSQIAPEGEHLLPPEALEDATLRQVVRVSLSGDRVRVRLSNLFGRAPLEIAAAHLARSAAHDSARIDPTADFPLTFGDRAGVVIPAGAEYLSDPVDLAVEAFDDLAVSLHLPRAPEGQTGHPGARAVSYLARGDQTTAPDLPDAETFTRWYVIAGADVLADAGAGAVAVLGDSITDGYGVEPNTNSRWTDFLAERLQADPGTRRLSVLNHGIGGNRLLRHGLGPNAMARFERDVLGQAGVTHLIVLIGVNDLGTLTREAPATPEQHAALVRDMTAAYGQMAARAREHGIVAVGATIPPYGGSDYYRPGPASEADRQALNAWIRAPGNFDAVIDFDAALRDPERPDRLRAEYDNDGLHPSIAGYRAMAEAVPLELFR